MIKGIPTFWSSFTSFRPTILSMTDSYFTTVFHRNPGRLVKAVTYSPQSSCCCCFVISKACSLRDMYLEQTVAPPKKKSD